MYGIVQAMDLSFHQPMLEWLAAQRAPMIGLTETWAAINSGSYHLVGLRRMRGALEQAFAPLGGQMEALPLAPITQINAKGEMVEVAMAEALSIRKRPEAPVQVLLMGHMDTVYGPEHPFQQTEWLSESLLRGPGVADLKGGLVVMLYALMALERSPLAGQIGWQVLINPDEEIGSVASDPWIQKAAVGKHVGLVYEPALLDGTMAGARKGSGNFTLVVRGRAAHAGRNPEEGRNAIAALAALTSGVYGLNGQREGVTLNPGKVEGGGALNVVPDLAILRFNIRTRMAEDEGWVMGEIERLVKQWSDKEGFSVELHGRFTRSPKPMHAKVQALFAQVEACARALNQPFAIKPSGGCCDGNNLWQHGLANVDTLGVRGANIHSDQEVVHLDSLVERAQLSALLLSRLAQSDA